MEDPSSNVYRRCKVRRHTCVFCVMKSNSRLKRRLIMLCGHEEANCLHEGNNNDSSTPWPGDLLPIEPSCTVEYHEWIQIIDDIGMSWHIETLNCTTSNGPGTMSAAHLNCSIKTVSEQRRKQTRETVAFVCIRIIHDGWLEPDPEPLNSTTSSKHENRRARQPRLLKKNKRAWEKRVYLAVGIRTTARQQHQGHFRTRWLLGFFCPFGVHNQTFRLRSIANTGR